MQDQNHRPNTQSAYQDRLSLLLRRNRDRFAAWLEAGGWLVMEPSSEYEVFRVRGAMPVVGPGGDCDVDPKTDTIIRGQALGSCRTSIIYRRRDGALTWGGDCLALWHLFAAGRPAPVQTEPVKVPKKGVSWTQRTREKLIERDGMECYYCGMTMAGHDHTGRPTPDGRDDVTIEHLLSQKVGRETGADVNHLDNLALAHAKCNRDIGHQPLSEKVIYRDIMHNRESRVDHWVRDDVHPPARRHS